MPTAKSLPPVIVLGVDTPIGLTVVRELGQRGVEVHGLAHGARGIGLYSRWLHRGYMYPKQRSELLDLLNDIARESGAEFLMTVSMIDAIAVRAAADAGRLPHLRPLLPSRDRLELVNDKLAVCRIAASLGIETPDTWEPTERELDEGIPERLTYPCILKWRDPELVHESLARHGLSVLKAEYAYGPAELKAALERYRAVGAFPLVQSFCPGAGLGQMFLMHGGRALLRFQHRRLAEWPPEGGVSTVCESVDAGEHGELMAKSEALLRRLDWEGPAMVEYRYDEATGRAVLMEINGRFWGSLPLAYHAGVPFAWGTYCALGLGRPIDEVPYRSGIRCRYMIPETRRLLTVLGLGQPIQNRSLRFSATQEVLTYLADFLRPNVRYYVFSLRDPRPFFVDIGYVISLAVRSLAKATRLLPSS